MSEILQEAEQLAEHVFQVTHYRRPVGNTGGWSQMTGPEMNAADAHRFIEDQQAAAEAEGLRPAQSAASAPEATSEGDGQAEAAEAASVDSGAAEADAGTQSEPVQ